MKKTLLFIIFSLFCSEVFAMSCENAWTMHTTHQPSSLIKAEIFFKSSLEKANLAYLFLQGVNLQGMNLKNAKLLGADLRGAILRYTDLQGAVLIGANLQGADFTGANLQGALVTYKQAEYLVEQGHIDFIIVN